MIKIFEGYAFVQVNTFGIIQQIDKEKFESYSKLLKIFLPIQDLYRAYRNVNLQFSLLRDLTTQYDAGKIDSNTVFNLTESSITAYILIHRMFVDNCKSFQRNYKNANISDLIIDLQNKNTEKNMKVLRDYAMHTSIPMSGVKMHTDMSNEADPKQRFHSTLRVKINADEMDTYGLSRQDRERINEWGRELDITAEIKTAWNNLKDFAKKVFKNYLDTYVDENLRKVVISDKKLWQDRLIPLKTIGITYQPKNSIPRDTVFMDYDALAYCIGCMLDE